MKKSLLAFIVILLISACGAPTSGLPNASNNSGDESTPGCISTEPTQADIDRALTFTKDLFRGSDWERSYTVQSGRVSVTWTNSVDGAVAYLEVLIFPCGYQESDLDDYFSILNWQVIFANYESYLLVGECKKGNDLRLYQFSAVEEGFDYDIKYWVEKDTKTNVISMMIVFPAESDALMDTHSKSLFPNFISCE